MTDAQRLESVEEFRERLQESIEDLEQTEEQLTELREWIDGAPSEWEGMSKNHRESLQQRAGEMRPKLRNITTPQELLEFGTEVREVFSEPIQQTAVAGFRRVVDLMELELPDDRLEEIENRILERPPTDLQSDAEGYNSVLKMLEDAPPFIRAMIAQKIEDDPSTYFIGPATDLTPLVGRVQKRRQALDRLEQVFSGAGRWVPDAFRSLTDVEQLYRPHDLNSDAISEEVDAIGRHVETSQYDLTDVVRSDLRRKFERTPPEDLKSLLNNASKELAKFHNRYHDALKTAEKVLAGDVPDALSETVDALERQFRQFEERDPDDIRTLNRVAEDVEQALKEVAKTTSDKLQTLETMSEMIQTKFDVSVDHQPPTTEDLNDLSSKSDYSDIEAAFEAIEAYRNWLDDAFDAIPTQIEAADVRNLFEKLYTEDGVPLSEVDMETLDVLREKVPIVVSLQS